MPELHPNLFPSRQAFDKIAQEDPPKAAAILQPMREAARRNLACFVAFRYFSQGRILAWNWHLDYLCDIFTAVYKRQLKRTIINIPPRHLKSELIGQCFPAWMIGVDDSPKSSVLSAGATALLAARDSRKALDIVRSDWYQRLFPNVQLAKETDAEWETRGGATRNAAGAGGTITGRGGDHLLWDDLLLPTDANSELVREKTNEWLGETFRSRLNDQETGTITGIMQRLHEVDPTGYLLAQAKNPDADQYTHIVLPLIAPEPKVISFQGRTYATRKTGDLLHPERISAKTAATLKATMRANFEGQFQQNPIKMEGGHLDPRRLVRLPGTALEVKSRLGLTPVFYIDFAATEKQTQKDDPDYSVILVGARDQLGRIVVLDVWRKQSADYAMLARTLIEMHKLWRPAFVKGERGALLNIFKPVLDAQMQLSGHFFALEPLPARRADKVERSMPLQGMMNAGMVAVPDAAPWLPAYESEMRAFPHGNKDDQVDPSSDLATDYQALPRGDAPMRHPASPAAELNQYYIDRINKARQEALQPVGSSNDDDW